MNPSSLRFNNLRDEGFISWYHPVLPAFRLASGSRRLLHFNAILRHQTTKVRPSCSGASKQRIRWTGFHLTRLSLPLSSLYSPSLQL